MSKLAAGLQPAACSWLHALTKHTAADGLPRWQHDVDTNAHNIAAALPDTPDRPPGTLSVTADPCQCSTHALPFLTSTLPSQRNDTLPERNLYHLPTPQRHFN